MNKLILSAAMLATLGLGVSTAAAAADGTITFTGNITATTCTVHGGTPTGAADFQVDLPSVSASAFAGLGAYAGAQPYSITLGGTGDTGCANGTVVAIHYEPTSPQIDSTTGNLIVTGAAPIATGVELQLLNGDKSAINLATVSDSASQTVANNTALLPFFAQYISTAANVTAGSADSSVLYSVKYN